MVPINGPRLSPGTLADPMQAKAIFDFYLKNKEAVERLRTSVYEEKVIDYVLSKVQTKEKKVSVEDLYNFDEKAA